MKKATLVNRIFLAMLTAISLSITTVSVQAITQNENELTQEDLNNSNRYFSYNGKEYRYELNEEEGVACVYQISGISNSKKLEDLSTISDSQVDEIFKAIVNCDITKDQNGDGKINILDGIIFKNNQEANLSNYIDISQVDLESLLKYYENDFPVNGLAIRAGDKAPTVTTVTTSNGVTSEVITTTTLKVTTTPISTTTVSTTNQNVVTTIITTIATTPKVTTTKATTTTPEVTTTTKATTTTPEVTTTTKATTTTPKVTTTTKATTTTPKVTTTTKATTTTPKVTTTPEATTTSPKTTTTPTENSLPLDPYGWEIEQEEYDGLVNTAELFGIENYKIVWTDELIPYSITIPSDSFMAIYDYSGSWGFQVIPYTTEIIPTNQVFGIYRVPYTMIAWRPTVDGETGTYVATPFALENEGSNPWEHNNWCLIPLDENGNEIKESLFKQTSEFIAPTIEEIRDKNDGRYISSSVYNTLISEAQNYGIEEYEITYSDERIDNTVIVLTEWFSNLNYAYDSFLYIKTEDLKNYISDEKIKQDLDPEDYDIFWMYFNSYDHVLIKPKASEYYKKYDNIDKGVVVDDWLIVSANGQFEWPKWSLKEIK